MKKLLFLAKDDDFGEQQNHCQAFISENHCVQIIQESYNGVFPSIDTDMHIIIQPLGDVPHKVWTKDRQTARKKLLRDGFKELRGSHMIISNKDSLVYRVFDFLEGDERHATW